MSIHILYYLHCTDCGKEFKEPFDDKVSLLKYAINKDGFQKKYQMVPQIRENKINDILNEPNGNI